MVSVRIDVEGFDNFAAEASRKMQRCMAIALTACAKKAKTELESTLRESLSAPTNFTMNSIYLYPAVYAKRNGQNWDRLTAEVGFKDYQAKYMDHMEANHTNLRAPKRFELALQAAGKMPRGWVSVPANGVALDSFGNMGRGFIMKIVSQLGNELLRGYQNRSRDEKTVAKNQKRNGAFVSIMPGGKLKMPPGIYQVFDYVGQVNGKTRYVRASRMVLMFVPAAKYKAVMNIKQVGQKTVRENLQSEFSRVFNS